MQKITIIQVLLGYLLLVCNTSCQKSEEVSSFKPTEQQVINAIKELPEYSKYLSINNKIQELTPSVIKGASTEQKAKYNTLRGKYTSTLEFLKENNLKTLEVISDIMKPIAELQTERLQIAQVIHKKLALKYDLEIKGTMMALLHSTPSNARTAQTSCSSQAYAAGWQAFNYAMDLFGDAGFAFAFADFAYSQAYRNCLDPINAPYTAIA